ncbi:MAG: amidohydrolase [Lachnospiraceae bacterium]|nr:amidohydrolase [Lachnospiraceae bacterium]
MREAEFAYINGNIYTADQKFSRVSAFAVSGDRFIAAGTSEEIRKLCTGNTKIVDLEGRTVLPGLIDSHLHVHNTGAMRMELNIVGKQRAEILDLVAEAAESLQPGEWIVGRGWINDAWEDTSFPSKEELDAVAPDNPVYLKRACGHAGWVNSRAFKEAGITGSTPDPIGGEYLRKPDGTLLGVVTDQAQEPFNRAIPPYNREQLGRIALLAQESFFSCGLTTVHDAGTAEEWIQVWEELYRKKELKVRIYASMRVVGRPSYEELYTGSMEFFRKGLRIGMYDNRLTARAYKISCDGSLGARSAWMLEDYSDRPGHKGNGKWTDEQLYQILYEARRAGFQTMCHAIGDGANRQCLDVYERLLAELPDPDARLRIEHAQILDQEDIPRFKRLGVIPTHQTVFLRTDKKVADDRLGPERVRGAYAWRTLIDQGNVLPNGTDSPVESCNPFLSMYCAVTRKDEYGKPEEGWYPQEALSREKALRSYTNWGAYAGFEEHLKGSIETGKLADFVVIDRDFMTCPDQELKDIQVLETYVGGECVYQK